MRISCGHSTSIPIMHTRIREAQTMRDGSSGGIAVLARANPHFIQKVEHA